MEEKQPTITLPISEFLGYLWGYKDIYYLSKGCHIHSALKSNPNPSVFHLQEEGEKLSKNLVAVWRARDWALDIQKTELEKANAEIRVESWNLRQEIKDELKILIAAKIGNLPGVPESIAENVLTTYNMGIVIAMGGGDVLMDKINELKQRQETKK